MPKDVSWFCPFSDFGAYSGTFEAPRFARPELALNERERSALVW